MRVDVSDQDEKISVGRQARVGKMVRRAGKACLIAKDPASLRTGLAIPGSHTLLFRQALPARLAAVRSVTEKGNWS
ncbi:hypothetical protein BZ160_02985 [Pantoea vagans]|nr:hypothetical protein BZ160_02985 [Pantoea vagans]